MKTLFIIGGIGSGKSTVSQLFAEQGIPVLDLDKVGHEVLLFPEVRDALVEVFGKTILDEKGNIVRSVLAAEAFSSPEATQKLTKITSTRIIQEMETWLDVQRSAQKTCVVVEVSAYDGPSGSYGGLTCEIVAVVASVEVRIERAVERGFDRVDVEQRIKRQASDTDRRQWAQYVIENEGTLEDLRRQVEAICAKINN